MGLVSIWRFAVPATLLAATGCAQLGPGGDERRPSVAPAYAPPYPSMPPAYAPEMGGGETSGVAAGIPYVERLTGGARAEEPLPMIVALHARGGDIEQFGRVFAGFPARARIIIPHGALGGGRGHRWWEPRAKESDPQVFAAAVRPVESQLAAAIAELRARRPTIGRVVVTGFSQGGTLSWSLAVLHPELIGAAFPFAGHLPYGFSPGTWNSPYRPEVHAFDGLNDPGNARTRASVDELRRMGIAADLNEYPLGHQLGSAELSDALRLMAAVVSRPGGPP